VTLDAIEGFVGHVFGAAKRHSDMVLVSRASPFP